MTEGSGDSWTRTNDPIDVNDVLYRLSHATTSVYLRPTSSVGHLEQFVLPTEPCDHVLSYEGTSRYWEHDTTKPDRPKAGTSKYHFRIPYRIWSAYAVLFAQPYMEFEDAVHTGKHAGNKDKEKDRV